MAFQTLRNYIYNNYKKFYLKGKEFYDNPIYKEVQAKNSIEYSKIPTRTQIINFLLSQNKNETIYLEIGVRNPEHNFNSIKADIKYSVDPGLEYEINPVDFKMTSDVFFKKLSINEILSNKIRFDVIFIDGLHIADQVDRDIENALSFIKNDGFIVLHDCNPPTEWHARECHKYIHTPAQGLWNGTTWKAFLKWRCNPSIFSCCIDTDWGVGILSKKHKIGNSIDLRNPFFEFSVLEKNRDEFLNLTNFEDFKNLINATIFKS